MGNAGKIEYVVDTKEVELSSLVIDDINDKVTSATLEASESQLVLRFLTKGVFAEDNENEMNNLAYRCFTVLAHKFQFSIYNLRRGGSSLPKKDGTLSTVINGFSLGWKIAGSRKQLNGDLQRLISNCLTLDNHHIQLIHQFTVARSEQDSVSRFIFLYNLALQINSDSQKKLDASVLQIDSSCNVSQSPVGNKVETVYTRIRNQLAHYRSKTNFEDTRNQVADVIDQFEQIVSAMLPKMEI